MNIQHQAENVKEATINKAKDTVKNSSDEIVKSGHDWLNYIKDHPYQSIIFGIIGYFAVKGLIKH